MEMEGDSKGKKRSKQSEEAVKHQDIISDLSDSLLVHILSFLPMEDAVKTGILSKRWDHLWTKGCRLHFNGPLSCKREVLEKFITFVDNTLSLLDCYNIEEFSLDFNKSSPEGTNEGENKEMTMFLLHVDRWIRCAVRRKVEVLYLNFSYNPKEGPLCGVPYKMPCHIFNNDTINELMLCFCSMNPMSPIQWKNLKSLFLYNIELTDSLVQSILSGTPLLEILRLSECTGMRSLNITSPILKSLALSLKTGPWLAVSAPLVETLEISGDIEKYRLMNVSSLVDFQLIPEGQSIDDSFQDILKGLLESVRHAKVLSLSTRCLQVLSMLEVKIWPSSSFCCNYLELKTSLTKWELPGIRLLLRTSPKLQTLAIQKGDECGGFHLDKNLLSKFDFDEGDYWSSMLSFPCMKRSLKTVKIYDFTGESSEIAMVEYLLKHSHVLQKLVIYSKKPEFVSDSELTSFTSNVIFKLSQKLLSFKRASPNAMVSFFLARVLY